MRAACGRKGSGMKRKGTGRVERKKSGKTDFDGSDPFGW
jgi:hypothetical protein